MTWWMSPGCLGGCDEGPYLGPITWPCPPQDCGWGQPAYPRDPPPPPPYDPQFPHPLYNPPPQFPHPQWDPQQPRFFPAGGVAQGKDCCGSCKKGGSCESECKEKPIVGATGYPNSLIEKFDAEVQKLNDAMSKAGPATQTQWAGWFPSWNVWLADHKASWLDIGFVEGPLATDFEGFVKRYNEFLETAHTTGLATTAQPFSLESPGEKALDAVTDAASKAAAAAAGALTTGLIWIAVIGAAGLLIYIAGPPLIARFAR